MIRFQHQNKIKEKVYSAAGDILPLGFLPKYKYYGGLSMLYWYNFLKKSQWYTKKAIEEYQTKNFLRLMRHMHRNVRYYKDYFKKSNLALSSFRELNDLGKLPIVSKDDIKQNSEEFAALNKHIFKPVKWHTGGSTGKPLNFYQDRSIRGLMGALGWRFQSWAGQVLRHRYVMMKSQIGYREGVLNDHTPYKYDPFARMLEINTINLDAQHLASAVHLVHDFDPYFLHSYPSIANLLALYVLKHKIDVKLRGVLVGSEMLYPEMRQNIEKAFNCKVFNFYGQEEGVAFAMECEERNMHLCFEMGILEVIKNGRPCKPGEVGEFVCTSLHNYSMPLIRYAMGDYGCYVDRRCPCGRDMPIVEITGGRNKDLLVTRSGVINILSHENISKKIRGIKEFQIVQHSIDKIQLKVVKDFDYADMYTAEMTNGLKKLLGEDMEISIDFVDSIPRTTAGKYKFIESHVPINL